jgi:hypothetical protein
MGLTMSERKAVTRQVATRYRRADRAARRPGKRLAPFLPELVERLRDAGELNLDDATAAQLVQMSAADIATGWTENRTVRNKAQRWVFAALTGISVEVPLPIRGIDFDNGGEFINAHLLRYCEANQITFTRSRPGNTNDGAREGDQEGQEHTFPDLCQDQSCRRPTSDPSPDRR